MKKRQKKYLVNEMRTRQLNYRFYENWVKFHLSKCKYFNQNSVQVKFTQFLYKLRKGSLSILLLIGQLIRGEDARY